MSTGHWLVVCFAVFWLGELVGHLHERAKWGPAPQAPAPAEKVCHHGTPEGEDCSNCFHDRGDRGDSAPAEKEEL